MTTTVLIITLAVGVLMLLAIIIRKLPQLRILDSTQQKSSERKLKTDIIRGRIERAQKRHAEVVTKTVINPVGGAIQNAFRRFAGKLTAVERAYQEKSKAADKTKKSAAVLDRIVSDAKALVSKGDLGKAEKMFIEVITNNPKHKKAYEALGRLYQKQKEFKTALETFLFLHKLSPKDASVLASLGEVEMELGKKQESLGYFEKAIELRPKNPKYLDMITDAAIKCGDAYKAQEFLDRLTKVNKSNKKIEKFQERIHELRSMIKKS